jgi:hypothetical protein
MAQKTDKKPEMNTEVKERRCLMCGERFESTWSGDRITAAWRQG